MASRPSLRVVDTCSGADVTGEVGRQLKKFSDLNDSIHNYAWEEERLGPLLNARRIHEAREAEQRDREALADEEERRARLRGLVFSR